LQSFQSLIEIRPQVQDGQVLRDEDLTGPAGSTRIWIDDINSDGKLDILVGDLVTLVSPANELNEKEFTKKYAQWQESVTKASELLNSTLDDEKARKEAQQKFQKVYNERNKFMKEDRTGFVWLYLQK